MKKTAAILALCILALAAPAQQMAGLVFEATATGTVTFAAATNAPHQYEVQGIYIAGVTNLATNTASATYTFTVNKAYPTWTAAVNTNVTPNTTNNFQWYTNNFAVQVSSQTVSTITSTTTWLPVRGPLLMSDPISRKLETLTITSDNTQQVFRVNIPMIGR